MKEKERMNGFTLTELLAVLVILAVIAIVAYPIVTKTVNNSREKLHKEQIERLTSAAKKYLTSEGETNCINVKDLQMAGYLDKGAIEDPKGGADLSTYHFNVTWDTTYNQYEYALVAGSC